jgi:hypothetical protein
VLNIVAGEKEMKDAMNRNDGGSEVIKIEDDEVERNSSQVRGQGQDSYEMVEPALTRRRPCPAPKHASNVTINRSLTTGRNRIDAKASA